MDRVEHDHVLKISCSCENDNEHRSHWASIGCCEKQEHKHFLCEECVPSCQACHVARVSSE